MKETLQALKSANDKTAIIDKNGQKTSFEEFYLDTTRTMAYLKKQGIQKNTSVLLLIPMDTTLYSTIAALFSLGATIVLVDPWASKEYVDGALNQINPDFVILNKMARVFFSRKSIRKIKNRIYKEDLLLKDPHFTLEEVVEVESDHSALITFTSGTTGVPKGFDRSHFFLISQQRAHEKYFGHEIHDIDMTMYPVFVLSNLKSLMTTVLLDGDLKNINTVSCERLHTQIIENKVNSLSLSPALLEKYISYLEKNNLKLTLNKIFTGGGPVSLRLCKRVINLSKECLASIVYGSTEAEPISLISFIEALENTSYDKAYPVGKVVEGHRSKLIKENYTLHPFHQFEPKELHLTGDFVGKKYLNNEKAFKESKYLDSEGNIWHKTGDILFQDDKEFLYMLGRANDIIHTKDGALFPLIVESFLETSLLLKRTCYIQINQKYYVFTESNDAKEKIKDHLLEKDIACDEVLFIPNIPVDSRHQTKLNRKKLEEDFNKGNLMINESSPLFKKILAYTNERFPLIPILLFVLLLSLSSANLLSTIFGGLELKWNNPLIYLSTLSLFLFMLQLRMSDEIKDFEKDKIAYPERILSKGIISLKSIEVILFSLIAVNILLNFFLGLKFFIFMCIIQVYALLMKEEFFLKEFLEKRIGIYLFTHQLILPLLCFYAALSLVDLSSFTLNLPLLFSLIYLSLPSTLYEIARKTWSSDRENDHADSYTKFWGVSKTVWFQMILLLLITWLCKLVPLNFNIYYLSILFGLNFLILCMLSLFKSKPTKKNSKFLELSGSVYLLIFHALNAFLLFN